MKDAYWGFFLSVCVHVVLFAVAGLSFFAVSQPSLLSMGDVEVSLVAGESIGEPVAEKRAPDPSSREKVDKDAFPVSQASQTSQTSQSDNKYKSDNGENENGSVQEASPRYLENPMPSYPEAARRRGQEGVVWVEVTVDISGEPIRVELKKSSGFSLLDAVAIKAVRGWKFKPASRGLMGIESNVTVPVRFRLDR